MHELGVIFTGMETDGDNKTHESLQKAKFTHLDVGEINCLECFEHAVKRMKINFFHAQEKALKSQRTENR